MNIQLKIVAFVLLLIVSAVVVGCAQKLTEELWLNHRLYRILFPTIRLPVNRLSKKRNNVKISVNTMINPISLPPVKKVGNRNKRLVLLPKASLRWLRAYGFKVNITSYAVMISLKKGNSHGRSYSSRPIKYSKGDDYDPQYLQVGNSRIMMTGFSRWGDVIWITDQFDNIRVLTYE